MREGEKVADIEKVIKGLEHCTSDGSTCDECDYWEHNRDEDDPHCGDVLMRDALELLKEQQEELACLKAEKVKAFDYLFSKIAGHSDYHGDSILCAIEAVKDGKEIQSVMPIVKEDEQE